MVPSCCLHPQRVAFMTFYRDKNQFEFSDYLRDSESFVLPDKKVIGKMKDEFKGNLISEFAGLKSKMYS